MTTTQEHGYPIPDVINPVGRQCYQIWIPDDPLHRAAFFGAITTLTKWFNWETTNDTRGKQTADVWVDVVNNISSCTDGGAVNVDFRVVDCVLEWRELPDGDWVPLSFVCGDKGDKGDPGSDGQDGMDGVSPPLPIFNFAGTILQIDVDADGVWDLQQDLQGDAATGGVYPTDPENVPDGFGRDNVCAGVFQSIDWLVDKMRDVMAEFQLVLNGAKTVGKAIEAIAETISGGVLELLPLDEIMDIIYNLNQASLDARKNYIDNATELEKWKFFLYCAIVGNGFVLTEDIWQDYLDYVDDNDPNPIGYPIATMGKIINEHIPYHIFAGRYVLYSNDEQNDCALLGWCPDPVTCVTITFDDTEGYIIHLGTREQNGGNPTWHARALQGSAGEDIATINVEVDTSECGAISYVRYHMRAESDATSDRNYIQRVRVDRGAGWEIEYDDSELLDEEHWHIRQRSFTAGLISRVEIQLTCGWVPEQNGIIRLDNIEVGLQ